MKHIFVVNPTAGPVDATESIKAALSDSDKDWEIYSTTCQGDATRFIRTWFSTHDEPVRFYACGGDGTLNEVVNGVFGHENASVGCYPSGSGNDYVKYFGGKEHFLNINALMEAENMPVDVMEVNGRYCINVANFGFDTSVARTMTKIRRYKIIGGKMAYPTGIIKALVTSMKTRCRVFIDGRPLGLSKVLLGTLADGSHVGSAFKCAPRSVIDDGLMEVTVVRPLSYIKFFSIIKQYMAGTHLDDPKHADCFIYCRAKTVELKAPKGFAITLDGEIVEGSHFVVNNLERAVLFGVPASCGIKSSVKEEAQTV